MNEPGFTPGPWRVEQPKHRPGTARGEGLRISRMGHYVASVLSYGRAPFEKKLANARLIAAAPELYEALERALPLLQTERDVLVECSTSPPEHDLATLHPDVKDDVAEMDAALSSMRAALAKARGHHD